MLRFKHCRNKVEFLHIIKNNLFNFLNMKGKIARLTDKGFGFISREGEAKDLFFHSNELTEGLQYNDLKEGEEVTFEVKDTEKGPAAINVARA